MAKAFQRLMLATEHSEYDRGAEALAFSMAQRCGLPLMAVLPVVSNPEFEMVAPQLAARADAEAAARRQGLVADAKAQGVQLELRVRRGSEPFEEIVAEAREQQADLIVIRRRGRRGLLANLLVGEMVSKVVAHAPCSVIVTPRDARMWSRRVMVGIDPSAPDEAVLGQASSIANECGLPLRVVCVATAEAGRAAAEQALARSMAAARSILRLPPEGECRVGRPHEMLIAAARDSESDLLVVARHGGGAMARAWIGGTAQKVIGLAECPVLVHLN